MSRNKDRLGTPKPQNVETPTQHVHQPSSDGGFSFVVPTEFVELPSRGRFYAPDHPLHNKETIEIKHMTAKDEDLLTSRSLLKKGIALDRVLESIIKDKNIQPNSLLVGDRNAIIVAMRVSGYGNIYETQITCPACGTQQKYGFDLNDVEVFNGDQRADDVTEHLGNGFFSTILPKMNIPATFRLLNGNDEKNALKNIESARKRKREENLITSHLNSILVSVDDNQSAEAIRYVIENMPSSDARHLRLAYRLASPNMDMNQFFECGSCDHEQELEVPLTADFFWPDR